MQDELGSTTKTLKRITPETQGLGTCLRLKLNHKNKANAPLNTRLNTVCSQDSPEKQPTECVHCTSILQNFLINFLATEQLLSSLSASCTLYLSYEGCPVLCRYIAYKIRGSCMFLQFFFSSSCLQYLRSWQPGSAKLYVLIFSLAQQELRRLQVTTFSSNSFFQESANDQIL